MNVKTQKKLKLQWINVIHGDRALSTFLIHPKILSTNQITKNIFIIYISFSDHCTTHILPVGFTLFPLGPAVVSILAMFAKSRQTF